MSAPRACAMLNPRSVRKGIAGGRAVAGRTNTSIT